MGLVRNIAEPPRRLVRERQTLVAMLHVYCRDHHAPQGGLCAACSGLRDYALARLTHCPFGSQKPTCAHCPVHCYKPEMRERIRNVMRYAGPRMLWRHPWLAILHLWDRRKPRPARPPRIRP